MLKWTFIGLICTKRSLASCFKTLLIYSDMFNRRVYFLKFTGHMPQKYSYFDKIICESWWFKKSFFNVMTLERKGVSVDWLVVQDDSSVIVIFKDSYCSSAATSKYLEVTCISV
jgi:hypothetical protein